eukprot:2369723-Pleurochrysis_carterae.AAC.4
MELCGFLKLASLVVGHRLHKLFLRVHHERSSRSDCLRDRLSREEDDARVVLVGAKSHAPAFAARFKSGGKNGVSDPPRRWRVLEDMKLEGQGETQMMQAERGRTI